MLGALYNLCVLLGGIVSLPKWLCQKRYHSSIKQRLGFNLPKNTTQQTPIIWIHMVSMGETRAMIPIYQSLRTSYPKAQIYLSSTTETGHEEAKRSLPDAAAYFFLPLDLSWNMQRLAKSLKPDLLILSESDFWYNLIKSVKKQKGKVILLNGKISDTSAKRFAKVPFFAKRLFGKIDHFCLQNSIYEKHFLSLYVPKSKITLTGNLKLSIPPKALSKEEKQKWQTHFGLTPNDQVITIGSSHEGEEELLLSQLEQIPNIKILLVPRHPKRFPAVKNLLEKINNDRIILVDQMGVLSLCYQLSTLAIVGGSFVPGIGGHNIFEPIQAHIPVLFGPHMENQKELVSMILEAKAGLQLEAKDIAETISSLLKTPSNLADNAKNLSEKSSEAHRLSLAAILPLS